MSPGILCGTAVVYLLLCVNLIGTSVNKQLLTQSVFVITLAQF